MLEKKFSNKSDYGYPESVKSLFHELGIELEEEECYLPLVKLLSEKEVTDYNYRIEMRNKIGHAPLVLPGGNVIAYCYLPNGSIAILVQNRKDVTEGKYAFCGGAQQIFKKGNKLAMESALLAAYREILEETSVSVNNIVLLPFFDYSSYIEYQNGDQVLAPSSFFIVELSYEHLLKMSKNECDEEWTHMTHSLVKIEDIDQEFINNFTSNHRQALIKFLNEFGK